MEGQFRDDLKTFPMHEPVKETAQSKKKTEEALTKAQVEGLKQLTAAEKAAQAEKQAQLEGSTRASLVRKIELYYQHFGHKLSTPPPKKLSVKMTSEELQAIVAAIEHELGMTGGIEIVKQGVSQVGLLLEAVTQRWNPLGLQLSSPVSLARTFEVNQDKWEELATELAIKYERTFCMSIEARCINFIAVMVWTVHRANKAGFGVHQAEEKGKGEEHVPADLFNEAESL